MKNVLSLQRNLAAELQDDREKTMVYVDKTKYGPLGNFLVTFKEQNLFFEQKPELNAGIAQSMAVWDSLGKDSGNDKQSESREMVEGESGAEEIVDDLVRRGKW